MTIGASVSPQVSKAKFCTVARRRAVDSAGIRSSTNTARRALVELVELVDLIDRATLRTEHHSPSRRSCKYV
jgi:hypothetical protein